LIVPVFLSLFVLGVLSALGTALGRARGFAAPVGLVTWIVLGNAATDLTVYSGGAEFQASAPAAFWLFMIVAGVHAVGVLVAVYDYRNADDGDTLDPVVEQLQQNPPTGGPVGGSKEGNQ
jgi:hypothetical protein